MFMVEFEDGQKILEGSDVNDWDSLPEKPIKAVAMLAGGQLVKVLSGYDSYCVENEAVQKASFSVDSGGNPVMTGVGKPQVVAQKYHCIRYCGRYKRRVSAYYDAELKQVEAKMESEKNPIVTNALKSYRETLIRRRDKVIDDLHNAEVATFSLEINAKVYPRKDLTVEKNRFRPGVPDDNSEEWFKMYLASLEKRDGRNTNNSK